MRKLRVGIIGPGAVTEHAMQHIDEVADSIESIIFCNYGDPSLQKRIEGHGNTLSSKLREKKKYPKSIDIVGPLEFDEFMEQSDVIIYNVGLKTPEQFLAGNQELVPHFDQLEGILYREAEKLCGSDQEAIADFISAYYILKEIKAVQEEGYFEDPFRMYIRLPAILPTTMRYAHRMKKYFNGKGISPSSKFLIVNANSSENNLNAFLSVIPEWKGAAVSLAIDRERLITLVNDDKSLNKPDGLELDIGVVGDHNCYIIPNFSRIEQKLRYAQEYRRLEAFNSRLAQNLNQFFEKMTEEVRNYYLKQKDYEDLLNHAGRGVIKILRSISGVSDGITATSGYFKTFKELDELFGKQLGTPLRQTYHLSDGKGLVFVDEHRTTWNGTEFKLIRQPQELDDRIKKLFLQCVEAHIKLYQRFIDNDLIPTYTFPGGLNKNG